MVLFGGGLPEFGLVWHEVVLFCFGGSAFVLRGLL